MKIKDFHEPFKKLNGDKMKILVVFYSRTGNTRKVADEIAELLNCKKEELTEKIGRTGIWGYLKAGRDAMMKKLTQIDIIKHNPEEYDMIIIGTPIWGWNLCPAIRTYLAENHEKFKSLAFFCTQNSSGADGTFKEMSRVSEFVPKSTLIVLEKEVKANNYTEKITEFAETLQSIQ